MLVKKSRWKSFETILFERPARTVVFSFLLLLILGTILFMLPISHVGTGHLSFSEALFTAVSAACVTGLSIHETYIFLSDFGKAVLLIMIQIGALGVVTLATSIFSLLGGRMKSRAILMAQETADVFSFTKIKSLFRFILLVTFTMEATGAAIFATQFVPIYGWGEGMFFSVFHSVSSFCNAGFDLSGTLLGAEDMVDSFYNSNPTVLFTTAALTIAGGLGFTVWEDFYAYRRRRRLSLNTRIILIGSAVLLLAGTLFYTLTEWNNTAPGAMGSLPTTQRSNAAFFLSVNMRSAGYTSLDLGQLSGASKLFSIFLMFIGGGPGSVAGGIRVTTMAILIWTIFAEYRGRSGVVLHRQFIHARTVRRCITIFFFGIFAVFLQVILLSVTERTALRTGDISAIDLLFESTATFSTTGLSTLGTRNLSFAGKALLIPFMFLGRIGPLTLAISMVLKEKNTVKKVYPEGKIMM